MLRGSGDLSPLSRPVVALTPAPATARTLYCPSSTPRVPIGPGVVSRTTKLHRIPHFAGFWSVKNTMFMSQWKTIHSNTWCDPLVAPRRHCCDYCLACPPGHSWKQLETAAVTKGFRFSFLPVQVAVIRCDCCTGSASNMSHVQTPPMAAANTFPLLTRW